MLTPEQQKLFDGYLEKWKTPMKFIHYKLAAALRFACSVAGVSHDDVENAALFEVARAAVGYDPSQQARFDTYANVFVKNGLLRVIQRATTDGRTIAGGKLISGDAERSTANGNTKTIFEQIGRRDPDLEAEANIQPLIEALKALDPRNRQLIELRWGLEDGVQRTLTEVGDIMGVTRERIRQLETKAKARIRNRLRGTALELEMLGLTA